MDLWCLGVLYARLREMFLAQILFCHIEIDKKINKHDKFQANWLKTEAKKGRNKRPIFFMKFESRPLESSSNPSKMMILS